MYIDLYTMRWYLFYFIYCFFFSSIFLFLSYLNRNVEMQKVGSEKCGEKNVYIEFTCIKHRKL